MSFEALRGASPIDESGPMRVTVDDDVCEYHGQCAIAAPGVFSLPSLNTLEYEENPSEEHLDDVEEAVDACPVQAISLEKGN